MSLRIVAELSANHLGSLDRALDIVSAAAHAGADAVKLQTFTPEQMVEPHVMISAGPWKGAHALTLYRACEVPREWHEPLFAHAKALGIEAFSSVFHPDDVDFLETLGCPRYKIASFELTDHTLIRHAARTGKPIIISTGMAELDEIIQAVEAVGDCRDVTLLKCTSAYPARPADANLATGDVMALHATLHYETTANRWAYRDKGCRIVKWGLSDHTLGIGVAVAAAALGASMIEKHLTLRRADGGPDAGFSMEPDEFAQMVIECRRAAEAVGEVRYGPSAAEADHLALRRAPGGKRSA